MSGSGVRWFRTHCAAPVAVAAAGGALACSAGMYCCQQDVPFLHRKGQSRATGGCLASADCLTAEAALVAAPVPVEVAGAAAGLAAEACSPEVRAALKLKVQVMTCAVHGSALRILQLLAGTVREGKGSAVEPAGTSQQIHTAHDARPGLNGFAPPTFLTITTMKVFSETLFSASVVSSFRTCREAGT